MCGRVRLSSDYSEIKIKLKFAPNAPAPFQVADDAGVPMIPPPSPIIDADDLEQV
jgi:hypothetical protein